jgi:RNA polymerase sigma-70 factor (ECF subfamily)
MPAQGDQLAHDAAQNVARASYGKLVAFLAKQTRDVAGAEDALSEAFAAALADWPQKGVPENPEAWLMAVAKRKIIDASRRRRSGEASTDHLQLMAEELEAMATREQHIPDERLALMFACAHPAIDPSIRSPLILQTVLGLDAVDIGSAFLVTPAAMGQRLARAKNKIKVAGIPFRVPERAELGERLDAVLEAIYAAYTKGWNDPANVQNNLADEAIWLGRLIVELLPREAEALGLLSLMLFLQSRREARRGLSGEFIPLTEQNPSLWDGDMIGDAERLLRRAGEMGVIGRYQLEAAIQSAHAARRLTAVTDWESIVALYEGLYKITASQVVAINHAVALAEVKGAEAGLVALPDLSANPELMEFQPYWAARAALLSRAELFGDAAEAYGMAIGLESDPAVRNFLLAKLSKVNSRMQ